MPETPEGITEKNDQERCLVISLQIAIPSHAWSKNVAEVALDAMLRGIVRPSAEKGPS